MSQGKGSARRPEDRAAVAANWDRVFAPRLSLTKAIHEASLRVAVVKMIHGDGPEVAASLASETEALVAECRIVGFNVSEGEE